MSTGEKKNVLFISIAFPPKRDPEAIQVAKYFRYLNKDKFNYEVVTSKNPTLYMDVDSSMMPYAEGNYKSIELPIFERKLINAAANRLAPFLMQFPDPKYHFRFQKNRVLKSITEKPNLLYSRSYPLSSTVLAYYIAMEFSQIPWVLHLSDPWALSSTKSKTPATYYHPLARGFNRRLEEQCFDRASVISFTSQKTIDLYAQAYPQHKHKLALFPNVYDDKQYVPGHINFEEPLRFVYSGGFGEKRDPEYILRPFKKLYENSPDLFKNVELIFTGEGTRLNNQKIAEYEDLPFFQNKGIVPYEDLIKIQRQASIFLNVDSPISNPAEAVFFPSKLLDYFVAQRKTIAITSPGSTTWNVINEGLGYCQPFDNDQDVMKLIEKCVDKFHERDRTYFELLSLPEKYSARLQAQKLETLFQELCN